MDADVIVVGGGLAGLVATCELIDAGKQGDPARPGAASSRWAGRRSGRSAACCSSTRPSSGACASATATTSRCRTGWARPASTARRTTGRASGPRPTSTSPPARSAPGCTRRGVRWFPDRRLGRARRLSRPPSTATRCRASTSPGARGPAIIAPFVAARARGRQGGPRVAALPPSRQRADAAAAGVVDGVRGEVLEPSERRARRAELAHRGRRLRAEGAGGRSSRRAASAATTTWCARAGRSGWATPPDAHALRRARPRRRAHARHRRGGRRQHHQPRPHVALHRGHHQLERRSGPARHPHPARAVVAVDRRARASACRCRCSRASIRWARSRTSCARRATTIPGSC